jgi:hypothetical protein
MERVVSGTYGSGMTPCEVFVVDRRRGGSRYVVEGGCNINLTYDEIEDGVDVEELRDEDCSTSQEPINSLEELVEYLNS